MKVGVLAFQGAVALQITKIRALGATPVEVRAEAAFDGLSGIILPGGESTTMLKLLKLHHLWQPLQRFGSERPIWGICAGSILMAKEVSGPNQESLGLMDIHAQRNAYGTQLDSFVDVLEPKASLPPVEGVFIRAPKLIPLGDSVTTLYSHGGEAVCLEQGHRLASSFHPELTADNTLHEYFLKKCRVAHG